MNVLPKQPHDAIVDFVHAELRNKATICGAVLEHARRLSRSGKRGSSLHQLVARARELCEDMAEMLVILDPAIDRGESATAADLQRQLELLEAEVMAPRSTPAGASKSLRKG